MADEETQTDRQGYITIVKGDAEAKIVPSSLRIWQKQGWDVQQAPGQQQTAPVQVVKES